MLFSQVFSWGYDLVNPPLYTWLIILAQELVGVHFASIAIVKFSLYGLIFYFFYQVSSWILADKLLSGLATLSLLWLYYVGWDAALSYSHTVLAACLIMASLFALFRLADKGDIRSYIFVGIVFGLGLISKYTFSLFILASLIAGLFSPLLRYRLLNPRFIISLVIMLIAFAPHGVWLSENLVGINFAVTEKFGISNSTGPVLSRVKGLFNFITSIVGFLSPLWIILCVLFFQPIKKIVGCPVNLDKYLKFLLTYFIILFGIIFSIIILFGISKIRGHYMFVFIPAPIAFFVWIKPALSEFKYIKLVVIFMTLAVALNGAGMIVKYISEPLRCSLCQFLVPYSKIAKELKKEGFKSGTIYAYYFPHDLAGNLRVQFPHARVVSTKFPSIPLKTNLAPGQCLIIWTPNPQGPMNGFGMLTQLKNQLKVEFPNQLWDGQVNTVPENFLSFKFERTKNKLGRFGYIIIPNGIGNCK